MQEVLEKIKERLEENQEITMYFDGRPPKQIIHYVDAIKIVNQVAEKYKSTDAWKVIYDKVLKLEQRYAKIDGDMEAVNNCIRLENLLQYFKEELRTAEEYSDGWIPCSERLPKYDYDTVLCVTDTNFWAVMVYTKEHGFRSGDMDFDGEVIAWRPLPEPYKEQNND